MDCHLGFRKAAPAVKMVRPPGQIGSPMRNQLKSFLRKAPLIYRILRQIRFYVYPSEGDRIRSRIVAALKPYESVYFVQIGSNDGVQGDPIHDLIVENKNWAGLFVEPVRHLFRRLQHNYGNSHRFTFENVAIGTAREIREFYYVSEDAEAACKGRLPDWYNQLGSFNREHIVRHLHGSLEPYICSELLETVLLDDVLRRNEVQRIDLLHIDTEGFDYQILVQVDFQKYHPAAILYEHVHLSDETKRLARSLLESAGYGFWVYGKDTLAISA